MAWPLLRGRRRLRRGPSSRRVSGRANRHLIQRQRHMGTGAALNGASAWFVAEQRFTPTLRVLMTLSSVMRLAPFFAAGNDRNLHVPSGEGPTIPFPLGVRRFRR